MSAAAVISTILITFLDMEPYMAAGIALAYDVLASAVSAWIYKKNGNVDVKMAWRGWLRCCTSLWWGAG